MKLSRRDVLKAFFGVVAGTVVVAAPTKATPLPRLASVKYVPPGAYIGQIVIDSKDITEASCDLLEAQYQDSLDQILAQEDQLWIERARAARHGIHF